MEETKQLRRDDELTLEISGSAFEGKCIAKHDKLVVFVEGAVPGDVVKVKDPEIEKEFCRSKSRRSHHTLSASRAAALQIFWRVRRMQMAACGIFGAA